MPIIHVDNGKEYKIIGTWDTDRNLFTKKVSASKHLFKTTDSWGIDAKFFVDVLYPNNAQIRISDMEEKKRYELSAHEFATHGEYKHFKSGGKDHRAQVFLPRRRWKITPLDGNRA